MRAKALGFVVASLVIVTIAATPASADTIYLKNGRLIRSEDVKVDGDRVVFLQHGGYQSLPMSLVERIEEDESVSPGSRNRAARADEQGSVAAASGAAAGPGAAAGGDVALQDLAAMLSGSSGGVDGAQALQLLQALGTGSADGSGLETLAPMLGALGGGGALGAVADDTAKVQVVLPAVTRLASALFAPEYSAADADAAAANLIRALESVGVSRAEIRQRARQLGVPAEVIDRLRAP